MPHTKTMSEVEYVSIMARALAAADEPLLELEFDESEFVIDWDAPPPVRVAPPVKTGGTGASSLPLSGTHPISIRVPVKILRAFKAQAEKTGVCYQTIMHRALREAAAGFV
jgi:hypothetical protein